MSKKNASTFKFCHFKASEKFFAKIDREPLHNNTNEWHKVEDCCYPSSMINGHFKKGIYVQSLYWGMNTFVHHCMFSSRMIIINQNNLPRNYFKAILNKTVHIKYRCPRFSNSITIFVLKSVYSESSTFSKKILQFSC